MSVSMDTVIRGADRATQVLRDAKTKRERGMALFIKSLALKIGEMSSEIREMESRVQDLELQIESDNRVSVGAVSIEVAKILDSVRDEVWLFKNAVANDPEPPSVEAVLVWVDELIEELKPFDKDRC